MKLHKCNRCGQNFIPKGGAHQGKYCSRKCVGESRKLAPGNTQAERRRYRYRTDAAYREKCKEMSRRGLRKKITAIKSDPDLHQKWLKHNREKLKKSVLGRRFDYLKKRRERYRKNAERERERARLWCKNNKEKRNESKRKYLKTLKYKVYKNATIIKDIMEKTFIK